MRFASLSLHKYGHLEDCRLHFPPGSPDFHLVFGANEAGKSTTLAATGDLLFGFPHLRAYDFRFHASLLLVGAELEDGQARLSIRRRRGEKNSLLDDAGEPVSEGRLSAMLHGRTPEAFRAGFALDHVRLRQGGRSMVDAKGNVGETLFAAGKGMPGAQALLKTLQAEADDIWKERGRTALYQTAARDRAEAEARVKAASVRPRDWKALRDDLDMLVKALATLTEQRATHQARLAILARLRALAAPVQQRAALLRELADLPATPYNASHDSIFEDVTRTILAAEQDRLSAGAAIEEAAATRATVTLDTAVLDAEARIGALVKEAGEVAKALHDLPAIQDELHELGAESDRLVRGLGLPAAPAASLLDSLPTAPALAGLRRRAEHGQTLQARLTQAGESLAAQRKALARAEAKLGAPAAEAPGMDAANALRDGRTVAAVAARLTERRLATRAAASVCAAAWRRLAPWTGDAAGLAGIVPPADGDCSGAETALAEAALAVQQGAQAAQAGRHALARLELEAAEVTRVSRAVSAGELEAARRARLLAWGSLRAHLADGAALADPAGTLRDYEEAVAAADRLADERFETATASLRLRELGVQIVLARQAAEQQAEAEAATSLQLAGLQREWRARLAQCGLPEMTPAAARRWARDQDAALEAARKLDLARDAEAEDAATVARAHAALRAVLPGHPAETPFATLLDAVQMVVDSGEAAARDRVGLTAAAKTAAEAVSAGERRVAELASEITGWSTDWTEASRQAGVALPPDDVAPVLPLFEQLRGALGALRKAQARSAGIARDEARFAAEAVALAALCGLVEPSLDPQAITERLRIRLRDALGDARAARELDATLARKRAEQREAERAIAAGEALLAPLLALGGLADRAMLASAMQAAKRRREAETALRALESGILAIGDGHPLDMLVTEAEAADPAWIAQETARVQASVAELDDGVAKAAEAVGKARHAFEALDSGENAALAAADEAQARAAMAEAAEAYLLKRAQVVMLKWAVDDYRKQQENPLLARASMLFARLTIGRYLALRIDRDGREPRLVAHSADGRNVITADAMSEGTADQLFLALRLAALEQSLDAGVVLPFLADDLFINFDDARARAGFAVLGEIARRTQVLFFTHHDHLRGLAEQALHPHQASACQLR